jgi:thymidine kinase
MNLLMIAYNYGLQGKHATLVKPAIDVRSGKMTIASRTGFERIADVVLGPEDPVVIDTTHTDCILVDEAQFLTPLQVDDLRNLTRFVPVVCYGLRTDYQSRLFPGAKRLMEVADVIEEIRTECFFCRSKAIMNMKFDGDLLVTEGTSAPELGGNEKYKPGCWSCWNHRLRLSRRQSV